LVQRRREVVYHFMLIYISLLDAYRAFFAPRRPPLNLVHVRQLRPRLSGAQLHYNCEPAQRRRRRKMEAQFRDGILIARPKGASLQNPLNTHSTICRSLAIRSSRRGINKIRLTFDPRPSLSAVLQPPLNTP
jgi:hypothetical protein